MTDLGEKLKAEAAGILRWAVEGCIEWQRDGLGDPTDLMSATAEYRREMDVIGDFLDERCTVNSSMRVSAAALYAEYRKWCDGRGEQTLTQTAFGLRLKERGLVNGRDTRGRHWTGVGLQMPNNEREAA
jgi:putative DNA primase/helicase